MTYPASPTIVVVDVETTGLDPLKHRIWEAGAISRTPGQDDIRWRAYVDLHHLRQAGQDLSQDGPNAKALSVGRFHERHPQIASAVVGNGEGAFLRSESEIARVYANLFGTSGDVILAATNPWFDAAFLRALLDRHDFTDVRWSYRLLNISDYAAGAMGLLPGTYGGDDLLDVYSIEPDPATRHTALGDCDVELQLLDRAYESVRDHSCWGK